MKKSKLWLGLAGSVLMLAACQQKQDATSENKMDKTEMASDKEKLTIAWSQDVGDLNPHRYNPDQFVTQDMVYEGLVRYGDNGVIEPVLAESWKISEDGKTYTFKLRHAKFSDGSEFNAKNVKRNFDTIFSEANKSNHSWFNFTQQLDTYKVVDDYTFELTLKQPYSATLYDLAMIRPIRFLGDAGFPEGDDTTKDNVKMSVGTGQWILKEKKKDEYATFVRNENYWGEKPKLKEVTIKIIADPQTRVLEFESGNLDLLYGNGLISLDTFAQYAKDSKYKTGVSDPLSTRLLLLNAKQPVFQDRVVRKAMNHAMNKKEISENLFRGTEKPADTIFSKKTPHSDAGLTPYEYDVKKAESLLDEAGWKKGADGVREKDGKKLTINMPYISTNAADKDLGEYFQGEWKKLGIDVQLQAMEENGYWTNAKSGNFDMMLTYSWGAPWDPHAWMTALAETAEHGHPESISLEALAVKPELDKVIRETLVEPDEAKVDAGYKKALTILHEEAVYIPITYQSVVSVYRAGELEGVRFAPEENSLPLRYISKAK
ncbi:nickel ABC transporter substrate-binding protein [Carnobacteriaceae bacterium zg-ZUI78]|nr:nickel ABC transporter substrate-binding protein [Carnobacteriaceae bacterium zg-ZUI78]